MHSSPRRKPSAAQTSLRLLIVGDSGVGKSSILTQFVDTRFSREFLPTIGVDFQTKVVDVTQPGEAKLSAPKRMINLQIYDSAGQQRFHTITASYFKGAQGVIIAYDVTSMRSFNNVNYWIEETKQNARPDVPILIMGNKTDLQEWREVSAEVGRDLAESEGYEFFEVSAKTSAGIKEAFCAFAKLIDKRRQEGEFHSIDLGTRAGNNRAKQSQGGGASAATNAKNPQAQTAGGGRTKAGAYKCFCIPGWK